MNKDALVVNLIAGLYVGSTHDKLRALEASRLDSSPMYDTLFYSSICPWVVMENSFDLAYDDGWIASDVDFLPHQSWVAFISETDSNGTHKYTTERNG